MDKLFAKDGDKIVCNMRVAEVEDERLISAAAAMAPDAKIRYICLTAGSKKPKLHKIKQDNPASATSSFSIGKSWHLDEIKSMEPLKDNAICVNLNGKSYFWITQESRNQIELMHTIMTLHVKHYGKTPKLIGIDEELLNDQMEISKQQNSSAQAPRGVNSSSGANGPVGGLSLPEVRTPGPAIQQYNNDLEAFLAKELKSASKDTLSDSANVFNMDDLLGGFNWQVNGDAADLEKKLESELQALEAANVHAVVESEEHADKILDSINATLDELKVIDDWLLVYTTLLDKMGQDVHSVEVKNKNLQVTSANQKNLLKEIETIVASMKLREPINERLKLESLDEPSGVKNCEHVLNVLMDTIAKIKFEEDIADIAMVKERISLYNSYATTFIVRFYDHVSKLISNQVELLSREKTRTNKVALKINGLDAVQQKICTYRSLMKWLKSVDTRKHYDLEMHYIDALGRFYKREIRDYLENLKSTFTKRKPNPEDVDYLFVVQQVTVTSAATNAVSNIVEKGKGWNITAPLGRKKTGNTMHTTAPDETTSMMEDTGIAISKMRIAKVDDDKIWPDEALQEFYNSFCPMVVCELNFVMDFFNIKKTDEKNLDFTYEWLEGLSNPREKLKELKSQSRLNEVYDGIFDLHDDISSFLEWGLKYNQTFTIGMMVAVEACIQKYSSSAYMNLVVQMELLMTRIVLIFDRFIDDQIRAIEETKQTFRKRTGILPFIRSFPKFVDYMEKSLDVNQSGQARVSVNTAYSRLVKCIFDTVESLAREHISDIGGGGGVSGYAAGLKEGVAAAVGAAGKAEGENLNVHILTIENMHQFHSEIRARKIPVLEPFVKASKVLYDVNVEAYVKIVIRKPLGKLLDFFENVETLLKSNAPEEVSFHLHKVTLRDILKKYPGKEIKKGLEQLYKRVEKNFSNEEGSSGLLQVVWRGIQEAVTKNLKRYEELIALCYPDTGLKVEFTIDDLLGYFSDLAQNH